MSLLRVLILLTIFFVTLNVGIYIVVLAAKQLGFIKKVLFKKYCLLPATSYILLFSFANFIDFPLKRFLLDGLGVLSFAAMASIAVLIVSAILSSFGNAQLLRNTFIRRSFLLAIISICIVAKYQFNQPLSIVNLAIQSEKLDRIYRFIHISDIQYGTISQSRMEDIIKRVYQLNPEFIAFTGDLIDFEGYNTEDFDIFTKSTVPIFFERGNHEFYHDPERLLMDLQTIAPISLLDNKQDSFGAIQITGIDYSKKAGHLRQQLQKLPLDNDKFSILLYHEPRDIVDGVNHGFDLMLYGHTHGGQIWPWTWLIDAMYEYGDGYFKVGNSHIYTSDGVSLWGPRMRLGSQNEIVIINLIPKKPIARQL